MADTLDEKDEDLEIIEVDKLPTAEELAARDRDDAAAADAAGDDEDDEDTHLAEHDDEDEDKGSDAKAKRKQRRAAQKAARDRTLAEVDMLRRQNAEFSERLGRIEGATVGMTEREIENKLENAKSRLVDLNALISKGIESGNGDGVTTAMQLRDDTRDEMRGYEAAKEHLKTARNTPAPAKPVDPLVATYAAQWRQQNMWYESAGSEEETAITKAIDNRLAAEGFDPKSPTYWQELTKRVKNRLGSADDDGDSGRAAPSGKPRAKGPAIGGDRSAGTPGARGQVYVTPERKAAMQEAGMWDDPEKRARMLRRYRDQDAQSAR